MPISAAYGREPRIGVALGGGGARGLAHIPFIEAMDELGLKPARIAGTSIGALIGAGWAAGMSGSELREHAFSVLGTVRLIAEAVWNVQRPSFGGLLKNGVSIQVDAEGITHAFLPDAFVQDFSELAIPFTTVAADISNWQPARFSAGSLRPAIAASLAIPSLFRPVRHEGRLLIDGGVVSPVPLAEANEDVDILIGIDVNGTPRGWPDGAEPSLFDVGFVASQIMTGALVRAEMAAHPPDLYVQPPVDAVGIMEFWRVRDIVADAGKDKESFKRALARLVDSVRLGGTHRLGEPG